VLLTVNLADAEGMALLESALQVGLPDPQTQAYAFMILLRSHFINGRTGPAKTAAKHFHTWARKQVVPDDRSELSRLLAECYCLSGAIHHGDGDPELARSRYQQAIEIRRDYALAMNNLAALILSEPTGRTSATVREALLLAERAVEIMPGTPDFRDTLGFALAAAGRPREAIAAYAEAVRMLRSGKGPDPAAQRHSLARTLVRMSMAQRITGEERAAAATLREATAVDPAVVADALYREAAGAGE
jgi:tetratricopeptide (TPR) repeat protein